MISDNLDVRRSNNRDGDEEDASGRRRAGRRRHDGGVAGSCGLEITSLMASRE